MEDHLPHICFKTILLHICKAIEIIIARACDGTGKNRKSRSVKNRKCQYHSDYGLKQCEYGGQGKVTGLHLCGRDLSQVPSSVWQFSSLQELHLDKNQLSDLPAEIGHLSALQELSITYNQLSSLPAEIGQLATLQVLFLNFNQLRTLPEEIGHLFALQNLSLYHNRLRTLPMEMGQLPALRLLFLDHNPFQLPLPNIIAQGTPALLAYLQALQPIKIFYCYAHEDKALRDKLGKHLSVLLRTEGVTEWCDRDILAGTEWEREIEAHLSTANIILLLVSPNFTASDYCYEVEMRKALEMHKKEKACVIPILLRSMDWGGMPFTHLQVLPTNARPITDRRKPSMN